MKNSISDNVSIMSTPLQEINIGNLGITLTANSELLSQIIPNSHNESFIPYVAHNKEKDSISAFWKNDEYYTKTLNMQLYLSNNNNEIIGIKILDVNKI